MFLVIGTVYLIDTAAITPLLTGLYVSGATLLGIVITVLVRHRLGTIEPKTSIPIILFLQITSVICVGLAAFSAYYLIPAAIFLAGAQLIIPALFVFDAKYGQSQQGNSNKGAYGIRIVMSLSWIVGPPLSFALYSVGQYRLVGSAVAMLMIVGCLNLLRRGEQSRSPEPALAPVVPAGDGLPPFWFLFLVMITVTSANSLHSIVLPLYLLNVLGTELYFPGAVIATAALVEVAVIAVLQRYDGRVREEFLLWFALVIGLIYFVTIGLIQDEFLIVLAQVLYGVHFALATTVCLPLLGRALTGAVSNVAAQFMNVIKVGALIGSGLFAVSAGRFGYLTLLTTVCSCLVAVGLLAGIWRLVHVSIGRGGVRP